MELYGFVYLLYFSNSSAMIKFRLFTHEIASLMVCNLLSFNAVCQIYWNLKKVTHEVERNHYYSFLYTVWSYLPKKIS